MFAIIAFLVLGTLFVVGLWPDQGFDFSNLTDHGGFLPNGVGAIFSSIVVVVFSMVGAEIATVAAAESDDPEKAIAKATQSVIVRVRTFYVGSVFLLVVHRAVERQRARRSRRTSRAFEEMGIPYADHIMNAVVLTAVLSCLNSGLYTASRMLFVLAARREAPMRLITVNSRGVPMWAILASTVVGFLSVIAAYVSPDTVFLFLLNSSGAVILFVYLLIAISQFVLRRRTPEDELHGEDVVLPVADDPRAVAGIVAVLVQMGLNDDTRSQLLLSLLSWGVVLVLYADHPVAGRLGAPRSRRCESRAGRGDADPRAGEPDDGRGRAARRARAASTGSDQATYFVVVPANPVDTGQADREGAAFVWEATTPGRAGAARPDPGGAARARAHGRGRAR